MGFEEVLIVSCAVVSCVGIGAIAFYLSEIKKEQMRQYGITSRAQMKLGNEPSPSSPSGEWWQPLAVELLKNPQIQNMILQKVAPTLTGEQVK